MDKETKINVWGIQEKLKFEVLPIICFVRNVILLSNLSIMENFCLKLCIFGKKLSNG